MQAASSAKPGQQPQVPGLTLYYSPGCIFCMRVFTALRLLGLEIASKNVMTDSQADAEFRKSGGSGMVPCLRIEDEKGIRWMYESADIIDYLHQRFQVA